MGRFGSDFTTEKNASVLRIACLGDSTTANNIALDGIDYSYPKLLQEHLSNHLSKVVEVYNFGIGGWSSSDIMIDFLLNVVSMRPDYVILCHGFVDLHLYLMEDFCRDYSHGRCNLGSKIGKIKMRALVPHIYYLHSYEYLRNKVFGTGNIRDEVMSALKTKPVDINKPYHDL